MSSELTNVVLGYEDYQGTNRKPETQDCKLMQELNDKISRGLKVGGINQIGGRISLHLPIRRKEGKKNSTPWKKTFSISQTNSAARFYSNYYLILQA